LKKTPVKKIIFAFIFVCALIGIACLTKEAIAKYKDTLTQTVPDITIVKKPVLIDIANATAAPIADIEYIDTVIYPPLTLTYQGETLVYGTDYTFTYVDNLPEAGNNHLFVNQINVSGIGRFYGTKIVNFNRYYWRCHLIIKGRMDGVTTDTIAPYTFDLYVNDELVVAGIDHYEGDISVGCVADCRNITVDSAHYVDGNTSTYLAKGKTFYLYIKSK